MICKKCKAWNDEKNKFCMKCGEELTEEIQSQTVEWQRQANQYSGNGLMTVAIILFILGAVGIFFGTVMFGDIGVLSTLIGIIAIVNGIGFIVAKKNLGGSR